MSEGGYFPRKNGTANRLTAILGLLAIAFWGGDFIGQWRASTGLERDIATLRSEIAVLRATVMFHDGKRGHSEVIERLKALESAVDHLQPPRSYRSPLGDFE